MTITVAPIVTAGRKSRVSPRERLQNLLPKLVLAPSFVLVVAESAQSAMQISASAGQQAIGMSQIQQAMRSINQATSQNLASSQQTEQAVRNLDTVGLRLSTLLRGATA